MYMIYNQKMIRKQIKCDSSIILNHSIIQNNISLKGVCIDNYSIITESHLENVTVLSNKKERTM